jgi:hypothetical protein
VIRFSGVTFFLSRPAFFFLAFFFLGPISLHAFTGDTAEAPSFLSRIMERTGFHSSGGYTAFDWAPG